MKFTAVLLNWMRPENALTVLTALCAHDRVEQVIVWNNSPAMMGAFGPKVRSVNASWNAGVDARFSAAMLAETDGILFLDDDQLMPPVTIEGLCAACEAQPDRQHGLYGRKLKPDGSYAIFADCYNTETEIMLIGASAVPKALAALFFQARLDPRVVAAQRAIAGLDTHPQNGEDIILSYAITRATGKQHRVHHLKAQVLPTGKRNESISNRKDHMAARTIMAQAARQLLE